MLGDKLKSFRKQRGLSLDDLSTKTGFSKSFLSQIENGKNSPSIVSLKKITEALGVSIGETFEKRQTERIRFVKRRDWQPFTQKGLEVAFVSSGVAGRKMETVFVTLNPGGRSDGFYSHDGEAFVTILEGSMVLSLDGEEYRMEEGDSLYFSSSIPHCWQNDSAKPARAFWVATPPTF